ncbi:MAG TPA: thioesterase family protein [Burkholderiaceae bacterium]|nr:thioesterase family protein [Burkholderiaceae bacterium]
MKPIPIGAKGSFELLVASEHLANYVKDPMLPPVLATPVMVTIMENAALNAVKPYLEAGKIALGTRLDVEHLSATPAGRTVCALAEVTRVEGRRIEFAVRALDGDEEIGRGRHERTLVDVSKLLQRLQAKFG